MLATYPHQPDPALLYDLGAFCRPAGLQPGMTAAQGRMAGERQFAHRGENAHPIIRCRLAWGQQEGGFAQVAPTGEGLHLLVREIGGIEHHGQRIAQQRLGGKDTTCLKART